MNDKLGATGKFPKGKINEHDEGELNIGITKNYNGKIMIDFGKPVMWIGLDPEEAIAIANAIIAKVKE
jgi:hypothetical protein